MGRIQDIDRYPYDEAVSGDDFLVGTDAEDTDITKSFKVDDLIAYISTQVSGASADNIFQEIDLGTMNDGDSISALANALASYTITDTGLALYTVSINPTTADGLARDLTYVTLLKGKGTYGVGGSALLDGDFYNINPVQLETVRNSIVIENLIGTDKILSGNVTYSGAGLVFESTAYSYLIGGDIYNADADNSITLSVGGAQPRKDIIVADTSGNITVIAGTEAASPAKPSLTNFDTQIELTVVDVAALATTPTGITEESIYFEFAGEPTEWTTTENTVGARISLNSSADPYAGTVSIRMVNAIDTDYVQFTNNVSVDMADHTHLVLRIKLDTALPSGFGWRVTPYLSGTQVIGSAGLLNGSYGLDGSNTTDYQLVVIPFTAFSTEVVFDAIRLTLFGSGGAETVYIDNVRLIAGIDETVGLNIPLNTSDLVNDGADGTNPFITALNQTLITLDEGNGDGYVLSDSNRADYGNIGNRATDLSTQFSAGSSLGAGGSYSFLAGEDQEIVGGVNAWGASSLGSTNRIGSGSNNVIGACAIGNFNTITLGYGAMAFGSYHTINMNANGFGLAGGMNVNLADIGTSGIGIALTVNARNQHVVGSANIAWAGSATAADRPIFTVGNGTYTTPATKWLPLVASDAFNVFADGTIDAPSYGTGTITGTATRFLAVDTNGNIIEEPISGTLQEVTNNGNTTTNALYTGKIWTSEIQNNDTGNLLIKGNQGLILQTYNPTSGETLFNGNGKVTSITIGEHINALRVARQFDDTLVQANTIYSSLHINDTVNISTKTGTAKYSALYINPAVTGGGDIRSIDSQTGNAIFASGHVQADDFRLNALNTAPSTAADTGTTGEIRFDANHIYVCTATNTWKRIAIATW